MNENTNAPTDKAREEAETLLGHDLTVTFDDAQRASEDITIRKVSLRNLPRFASVMTVDEAAEIGFYTGKAPSWAEELSEESINKILETGRRLNLKRFENFALRATKFDDLMRTSSPALAQLAENAQKALLASRLQGASNT